MANSKGLSDNKKQHAPKNTHSKQMEDSINSAVKQVLTVAKHNELFTQMERNNMHLIWSKGFSNKALVKFIRQKRPNYPFAPEFLNDLSDREIRPDGGCVFLVSKDVSNTEDMINSNSFFYPVLISEAKRQGTNDIREQNLLKKQATGNAIERLGKNISFVKTAMGAERIVPFVCFGHGCDFADNQLTVLNKLYPFCNFQSLNRTYLDRIDTGGGFYENCVSLYFRELEWSEKEMFDIMYEILSYSVKTFLSTI